MEPVFSLFAQLYITAACLSPTTIPQTLLAFCLNLKLNGSFKLNILAKLLEKGKIKSMTERGTEHVYVYVYMYVP